MSASVEDALLNEPQTEAVLHVDGPLLVFAGAGSGKTRVITYRIANLVASVHVPPYRILAVTFTNKAAGEMRERLAALLGPGLAGDLWVGTFHATCARLLRRYHDEVGLARGFSIYDESDQLAVVRRVLKDRGYADRDVTPKQILGRIHAYKQEDVPPSDPRVEERDGQLVAEVYAGYENMLRASSAVDFDDLLLHVLHLVEGASAAGEELRARFRHVLVDEFQDTNPVQYRLVRAFASQHHNLCVVGDDDQSIYSWRGADVRLILGFRRDFPEAVVVKLEQNYRSTKPVLAAALAVIRGARRREPKELWTAVGGGEPVRVRSVANEREEADWVVRTLRAETGRGTPANEIAVFYRIHAQSRVLEEALLGARVPHQIVGGMRFFERAEVKDLIGYLRLCDNPRSDADLARIINVPARGIGDKTIDALLEVATRRGTSAWDALPWAIESSSLGAGPKKKLAAFKDIIERLRLAAATLGPAALAERALDESGYRASLVAADTHEADARLGNLEELVGALNEYEADARARGEEPSLSGWLERITLQAAQDTMSNEPMVSLMTVHTAKGLEFQTVIVTGMEEDVFPYGGVDGDDRDDDEERRLAYVAITRARSRLYLAHASVRTLFGRTRWQEPSRFLADLPREGVVREGAARSAAYPGSSPGHGSAYGYGSAGARASAARPSPGYGARGPAQRVPLQRPGHDFDAVDAPGGDDEGVELRPGDTVRHERYGRGTVEEITFGAEPTVRAHFPQHGSKKVLARFLRPG